MADKEVPLSIVIRTVDKATAGLQAINKRIEALTKPTKDFGKEIGKLRENSGLDNVLEGFSGVGSALKDILGGLLAVGGAIVGVGIALKSLIDEFDDMGDKAEKLGVTVDFLAAMRFAAERSGASVEDLDSGLTTFSENLGKARVNAGRMVKALAGEHGISPVLLAQLKATKSTEGAFRLLADAMSKVKDPAERAALAVATVGNSSLAPTLARGSKGLAELQGTFIGFSGSIDGAAETAGSVDDSMKNLKASTLGVKAAIVSGLGPALDVLVQQLTQWFVDHREDVKKWAAQLGEKIPAAVNAVVDAFNYALDTVLPFIDSIGGIKTVAIALAAIIVGPLVASIYSLGVALLTTPVGWIVTAIGLIVLGAYELIKHWDAVSDFFVSLWDGVVDIFWRAVKIIKDAFVTFPLVKLIIDNWTSIKDFFVDLWDGIVLVFNKNWQIIKGIVDKIIGAASAVKDAVSSAIDFINPFSSDDAPTVQAPSILGSANQIRAAAGLGTGATGGGGEARVKVDFTNAPRGTRVTTDPQSPVEVDMTVGYQLIGVGA